MQSAAGHHSDAPGRPLPWRWPDAHLPYRYLARRDWAIRALFQNAPWQPSGRLTNPKPGLWKAILRFLLVSDQMSPAALFANAAPPVAHSERFDHDPAVERRHAQALHR